MKVRIADRCSCFWICCLHCAQTTGVSHPDPAVITTNDDSADQPATKPVCDRATALSAKPSAALRRVLRRGEVYGSLCAVHGTAVLMYACWLRTRLRL